MTKEEWEALEQELRDKQREIAEEERATRAALSAAHATIARLEAALRMALDVLTVPYGVVYDPDPAIEVARAALSPREGGK